MFLFYWTLASNFEKIGGKGIRTPDFQLAKLALYQLSYAPAKLKIGDGKWKMGKCNVTTPLLRLSSPLR